MFMIPPPQSVAAATGPRTATRFVARGLLLALIVFGCVSLVAWLTLHWGILPHIQQWRDPIAERVGRALGVPVRIGSIEARTGRWIPSLELHDVVLSDPSGRPALRLARVQAALSARSLWAFELRFDQLLIDGPDLEIRRDAAGRLHVAGLTFGGKAESGADDAGADWLFAQREIVIRGGTLRWIDEQRPAAPALALTEVQLVVRNGLTRHDLRIDATPPAEWGDRWTAIGRFTQPFFASRADWRRWSGEGYLDLPRADVRALARHVDLPFELRAGNGALRAWVEVRDGEPAGATLDLALRAVEARLAKDVEPLSLEAVEGRLSGQRRADGVALALRRFTFETADRLRWPRGDATLAWRQRPDGPPTGGALTADRLDVGLMAQIASRLPLGASLRRLLAELDPKGALTGLDARWDGPLDAPDDYRVRGRLEQGSLASRAGPVADEPGRPGMRNADIRFDANQRGGEAHVVLDGGGLDLPGVFDDPQVAFDRFDAQIGWKIEAPAKSARPDEPPALAVEVRSAHFANADAAGELEAHWRTGAVAPTASTPPTASTNATAQLAERPASGVSGTRRTPVLLPAGRTADRAANRPGDRSDDHPSSRFPGHLELDAKLSRGNAARVPRYLPLGLPKKTRIYLTQAIGGGRLANAAFHARGDLRDFPFLDATRGHSGEFRIAARVEDGTYAFAPAAPGAAAEWPSLTKLDADLLLDGRILTLHNARARIGAIDFAKVEATLRDLGGDPVLSVDGSGRGALAEMVRLVGATPVSRWLDHALDRAVATGGADLNLGLTVPLDRLDTTTVRGSLVLAGNDLRFAPGTPPLGAARGRVDFTNKGFTLVDASARLYGGDSSLEGGTQPDGSVHFNAQGSVAAEALRRADELGPVARIAGALTGQTKVRASLGFVRGQPDLAIASDLVGLRIDLPAPLGKAAETPLVLRVAQTVEPAGEALRDTLHVDLGSTFQAAWQRELGGTEPRVLRGGIGLYQPPPQPMNGVAAAATLPRLEVDDWRAAIDRLFPANLPAVAGTSGLPGGAVTPGAPAPASSSSAGAVGGANGNSNAVAESSGSYLPNSVALSTPELVVGQRRLTHVSLGASEDGGVWRANVDADQLGGYLEYRLPSARGGGVGGRLYARLARLIIPKGDDVQVESLLDEQPTTLPSLDLAIDDFELRGRRLGRVRVEAVNRPGSQGRDWQLSKLDVTTPEATFAATGQWTAPGRNLPRRTTMDFHLGITDSGALLERLGTPGAVRGGKGELSGQLGWTGSPLALDYPTLSGQVAIAVQAGQFLKVDPGAARLLGVLSLQSLPRRLSLDFRDLFGDGFAFDGIDGDLTIAKGVATTRNLRMRGVQAVVLMEGQADIAAETEDVRAIVVPEISAGTAALAYAVINPVLGLGAFLAQAILKKPLTAAGTREFRVEGPWADPKVERIERKFGDDVPDVSAPPASASH